MSLIAISKRLPCVPRDISPGMVKATSASANIEPGPGGLPEPENAAACDQMLRRLSGGFRHEVIGRRVAAFLVWEPFRLNNGRRTSAVDRCRVTGSRVARAMPALLSANASGPDPASVICGSTMQACVAGIDPGQDPDDAAALHGRNDPEPVLLARGGVGLKCLPPVEYPRRTEGRDGAAGETFPGFSRGFTV